MLPEYFAVHIFAFELPEQIRCNIMALEMFAPTFSILGKKKNRFHVINRSCFTLFDITNCIDRQRLYIIAVKILDNVITPWKWWDIEI
jgi:hypothetical protein